MTIEARRILPEGESEDSRKDDANAWKDDEADVVASDDDDVGEGGRAAAVVEEEAKAECTKCLLCDDAPPAAA